MESQAHTRFKLDTNAQEFKLDTNAQDFKIAAQSHSLPPGQVPRRVREYARIDPRRAYGSWKAAAFFAR